MKELIIQNMKYEDSIVITTINFKFSIICILNKMEAVIKIDQMKIALHVTTK